MNHPIIRLEEEKDHRIVENLTREAFWNVYEPGCHEHYFVHQMRLHPDFLPELSFVAEKDGEVAGAILYTRAWLESMEGERKEILTFGPLCVLPQFQRQGYSRLLIEHSFARAVELGYDTVVILGNPANYVGRGFVSCRKKQVCMGGGFYPAALLVKELVPGVLAGKSWQFFESSVGECCDDIAAVEAFDRTFPPKEKAWNPSQEEFYIYSHSCIAFP